MSIDKIAAYRLFKYAIYLLLAANIVYFLVEGLGAAAYTHEGRLGLGDMIVAFTESIDGAAWLILLLLLEVETAVVESDEISPVAFAAIEGVTAACYAVIVYSFYGYVQTLGLPAGFASWSGPDVCSLVGSTAASVAYDLEQFRPLAAETCLDVGPSVLFNAELNMFASAASVAEMNRLGWLDVINSGVWLVVVSVLVLEIHLKRRTRFGGGFFKAYKAGKAALYAVLVAVAVEWARLGAAADAWDAFLWLLAFVFIEMNLFSWQKEAAAKRTAAREARSARAVA